MNASHYYQDIGDCLNKPENSEVTILGRVVRMCNMGKVCFCDLQDDSGVIQLYGRKEELSEAGYNQLQQCRIADIVGANGKIFRTKRGEKSVRIQMLVLRCPTFDHI